MTAGEFSKYVIENMNRATLVNALNIPNKFNLYDENGYEPMDFIVGIYDYFKDSNNIARYEPHTMVEILYFAHCFEEKYLNDKFKYNKKMLLDTLIIHLWGTLGGIKL